MAYGNITNFYHIPFMAAGDYLTEEGERQQMAMIDDILRVSLFGCSKVLLEEGNYAVSWENNVGTLSIGVNNNGYSLLGIVNGRSFALRTEQTTGNFNIGGRYHVYLEHSILSDENVFSLASYLENEIDLPPESDGKIKLCVVEDYIITKDPGRWNPNGILVPTATGIFAHASVNVNPHGETLVQNNLQVNNALTIKGNVVNGSQYVNFTTGGNSGTEIEVNGSAVSTRPAFVFLSAGSTGVGEMWWVHENGHLKVYNSGASGLAAYAKIDYV